MAGAPACVSVKLRVLVSSMLNAVNVTYSGITARLSNMAEIQHGASGDGKSIIVWLPSQALQAWQRCMQYRADKAWAQRHVELVGWKSIPADQEGRQPLVRPGGNPMLKHVYRKGLLHGLAYDMQQYRGRATSLKHEGNIFLNSLMASSSAAGTMDELNVLMDHGLYSRSVLTAGHDIMVDNPHLCAYIAMHAAEFG